jgi:hypothetical protein
MRFIPPQYGNRHRERKLVYGLIKPTSAHVLFAWKTTRILQFIAHERRSVLRTLFPAEGSSEEEAVWRE